MKRNTPEIKSFAAILLLTLLVLSIVSPTILVISGTRPKAYPDYYSTPKNTTLLVPAPGVLNNDIGEGLQAYLAKGKQPKGLDFNTDGSFSYTPPNNFEGVVTFKYYVKDIYGQKSAPVKVYITVGAVPIFVTLNIIEPSEDETYTTSTIPVEIDSNATTVVYNVKNGTEWVFPTNQTYSGPTSMTGFVNGTYTFYAWALAPATAEDSVNFTVAIPETSPTYYTLTVITPTGGSINATNGSYLAGTVIGLLATPDSGYTFANWRINGVNQTDNPISLTMDQDYTVEAFFVLVTPPPPPPPPPQTVTLNIIKPKNMTYTTGSIDVEISTNATSVEYNIKRGDSWIYSTNQTFTGNFTIGVTNGTYTFYAWAKTPATAERSVTFTVAIPAGGETGTPPPVETEEQRKAREDAGAILDIISGGIVAGEEDLFNYDYNHDGMIDILDAFLRLYDAGLLPWPDYRFTPEAAQKYLALLEAQYGKDLINYPTIDGRVYLLFILTYLPYVQMP